MTHKDPCGKGAISPEHS